MSILLTKEERAGLKFPVPDGYTPEDILDLFATGMIKAQILKLVEWLDTLEFFDDWGGESAEIFRDIVKEALLKEIE